MKEKRERKQDKRRIVKKKLKKKSQREKTWKIEHKKIGQILR